MFQIEILRPIAGPAWTGTLNSYSNRVMDNIEWREKNEPLIGAWLKEENPPLVKAKKAFTRLSNVDQNVIDEDRGMFKKF